MADADLVLDGLPAGAVVDEVMVAVTAEGTSRTAMIGEVAHVRSSRGSPTGPSKSIEVDFGRLRTVSGLSVSPPWDGLMARLDAKSGLTKLLHATGAGPVETLTFNVGAPTDRLDILFTEEVAPFEVAAAGTVQILGEPADVEVLVNGSRAWFGPGPAPALTTIDITRAVQAEVAAGRAPVRVGVRSASPGDLSVTLAGPVKFHHVHQVSFPEGPTRAVEATVEGEFGLDLPLPGEATGWTVVGVELTVRAKVGPSRAVPSTGPLLSDDAVVIVDAEHAVAIRLPPQLVQKLASLTALELPLQTSRQGAEVTAVLRGGDEHRPGVPLPQGQMGPLTLGPSGDVRWVTLPLARPLALHAGQPLWAAVHVSRGSATVGLTAPDPAGGVSVASLLPGGASRPLTVSVPDLPRISAALRLLGLAPAHAPIPALDLGVTGSKPRVSLTPTADGVAAVLPLSPPVIPVADGATAARLPLSAMASAPATYVFGPVHLSYHLRRG